MLCDDGLSRAYALFCKPAQLGGDSVAETRRILAHMEVWPCAWRVTGEGRSMGDEACMHELHGSVRLCTL